MKAIIVHVTGKSNIESPLIFDSSYGDLKTKIVLGKFMGEIHLDSQTGMVKVCYEVFYEL